MSVLLVGFDSAWTRHNSGAIVGVLGRDGTLRELGLPHIVDYESAERLILGWQAAHVPTTTIVLLDQPTIVTNAAGARPVDHIVTSAVSLRRGGMQPANTGKADMFGKDAPVWGFLGRFGGAADPLGSSGPTAVFETYPVLVMIALGWMREDSRRAGRLPKYNPARRRTFAQTDWTYVCGRVSDALAEHALLGLARWARSAGSKAAPSKHEQDQVDACICLLVALHLAEERDGLMVGDQQSGYIVVPDSSDLRAELKARCIRVQRSPSDWVRLFRLPGRVS